MGESKRIRVLIADDHPMFRDGVARSIEERSGLELVGEADDGRTALEAIERLTPDVAVVDLKLPKLTGAQVAEAVSQRGISTRVIVLSAFNDSPFVYEAVAAGAAGYLSKDQDSGELCEAIVAVARGGTVLPESLHSGIAAEIRSHSAAQKAGLTRREMEILALAADGLKTRDMAEHLHLSEPTIKTHLRNIFEKLGVRDRAAAVAEAMRCGLLT